MEKLKKMKNFELIRKLKKFSYLLSLLLCYNLYSQKYDIDQIFSNRSEVYFTFTIKSLAEIKELTKIVSIDNVKGHQVWAYANKKEFQDIILRGYEINILPPPSSLYVPVMKDNYNLREINEWDAYPTYQAYLDLMQQFQTNYPTLCRIDTIGRSVEGRLILAARISDNVGIDEDEPEFFYSSSIHGDELTGYVIMLRLIDSLLSAYNISPRIKNIVDNVDLWICPLANPDGAYKGGNNTVSQATRYNANGYDLNRNFPDPVNGLYPTGLWQPETEAFMNFAKKRDFVMGLNFHGGAEVFNYPWDCKYAPTADENWWIFVAKEYADTAKANAPSNYMTDVSSNGYINGADWYIVHGGRQDYMNYWHHCREATFEISTPKLPPASTLPNYWKYNRRSLLNFIEQSLYGIRGIVKDACTGQPIKANIKILNHDVDSSNVYSSLPVGNYHRPVLAGTYTLVFSAPGYKSDTIFNVTVSNYSTVIKNVMLTPLPPVADFIVNLSNSCNGIVQFNSKVNGNNYYFWDFGDGTTSTSQNPLHVYQNTGVYSVKLKVENCSGVDSVLKQNFVNVNLLPSPIVITDSICPGENASLYAQGQGFIEWFDAPQSLNSITIGNNFTTSPLYNNAIYYAQDVVLPDTFKVGPIDHTIGNGQFLNSQNEHYLVFNVYKPIKITSVKVVANGTAYRTISLKDSIGNVIWSKDIYIPDGISRVTLNFIVPEGNNYRLCAQSYANLYRNNTGVNYPYTLTGMLSITGSSAGSNYYYYFYDWEITNATECRSAKVPLTVVVNQLPLVDAGDNQLVSSGTSVHLSAVVSGGSGNYSWQWAPTELLLNPFEQNPTTIPLSSSVIFTVTATDLTTGCSGTDIVVINVEGSQLSVIAYADPQTICYGDSSQLKAYATGGTLNYTYTWASNPTGFSANIYNPFVKPEQTTIYYVTVNDGTNFATSSIEVVVNPLPQQPLIYRNGDTLYTDPFPSGLYQWFNSSGPIAGANSYFYIPYYTDTFYVKITDFNNCKSTSDPYYFVYTNDLEEIDLKDVKISFLPELNLIYIDNNTQKEISISIHDVSGRLVYQTTSNSLRLLLSTEIFSKGIYFLTILSNEYVCVRKLILK